MPPPQSEAKALVYGILPSEEAVFIPAERAVELAQAHRALMTATTWGELKAKAPAPLYQDLLERFRDRADDDEALPSEEQPFDADDFGYSDGDIPGWPAAEMLDWMPTAVQAQYGRREPTTISGDYLALPGDAVDAIASALARRGYQCTRDDDLVTRASGYEGGSIA